MQIDLVHDVSSVIMLKHRSNSRIDITEQSQVGQTKYPKKDVERPECLAKTRLLNKIRLGNPSARRLSISLSYINQETVHGSNGISDENKEKFRKHSLSHSLDGEVSTAAVQFVRIYASCLRSDIEYLTVKINKVTTVQEIIQNLLNRHKVRYVDSNLFFLSMEVSMQEIKTPIKLSSEDRLSELIHCSPWHESSFRLCCEPGILLKVNVSAVVVGSRYKSLKIASNTTVGKVISMMSGSNNILGLVLIEEGKGVLDMNLCLGVQNWEGRHLLLTRVEERKEVIHKGVVGLRRQPSQHSLESVDSGYSGLSVQKIDE